MILIDTSVWIEFFKQKEPFNKDIRSLLEAHVVAAIEPVFAELLYGVRNRKEKQIVLSYWQTLPRIEFRSHSMIEAAQYANSNQYLQSGIGLMDAIIIKSVSDGSHLLWTLDKRMLKGIDPKFIYQA